MISVLELRVGAGLMPPAAAAGQKVDGFLGAFEVLGVTGEIADRAAEIRVHLRRQGKALGDFDLLIAATALVFDYPLLSSDRDFESVPGLHLLMLSS